MAMSSSKRGAFIQFFRHLYKITIPSLGIKMDANQGQLKQSRLLVNIPEVFYAHCSETNEPEYLKY